MLSPAAAAVVAGCSVRTIRRAYLGGTLLAYRDARGRGVRIRYGDLREWMMCEVVQGSGAVGAVAEGDRISGVSRGGAGSDNLALLVAARERRAKRG
jgi:excisionase family DNA binding protein